MYVGRGKMSNDPKRVRDEMTELDSPHNKTTSEHQAWVQAWPSLLANISILLAPTWQALADLGKTLMAEGIRQPGSGSAGNFLVEARRDLGGQLIPYILVVGSK